MNIFMSMKQVSTDGNCCTRWVRERLTQYGIKIFTINRKQFVLREEFAKLWKHSS